MSGKFSNTGTTFAASNIFKQQQYIRQIVQSQVFLIFEDIKIQIESKIKSIDKNITELRSEVRKMCDQQKMSHFNDILQKMQKVEAEMQILKYHQQNTLKVSRSKSLDKERKPIFKKQDNHYDFSSIVLGLESEPEIRSSKIILENKQINTKPPLPKQSSKLSKAQIQQIKSVPRVVKEQRTIFNQRNPAIEEASAVHRWLTENNNRQSSCFSSIIREQQVEQSVFY